MRTPTQAPGRHHNRSEGQAQRVLDLFDQKASTWSAKYAPGGPLVGRLAILSDVVGCYVKADGRVLDLGCGTGELTRALAASGIWTIGCDISGQMLRRAAGEPGSCAGWTQLDPDWRRLPFASSSFDVVVAASVLEYLAEPAAVLAECARVLRPDGVVLCTVPDLRHPVRWAEWVARLLAGTSPLRAEARTSLRWGRYRAYLCTSRQRHRVRWWLAAAASADLCPVCCHGHVARSPLRLLAFRRAGPDVAAAAIVDTARAQIGDITHHLDRGGQR